MRLTTRRALAMMLSIVLLLSVLPAVSADTAAEEVLYHRVATGDVTQDLVGAWETNASADAVHLDTEGRYYACLKTNAAAKLAQNAWIDVDLDFVPEDSGSELEPYGVSFAADDYKVVRLHFTYAYRYDLSREYYNLGQLEKTRVYLSCDDGATWTTEYADITAQNYLGDGDFYGEKNPRFSLYEVVCDLSDILPAGKTVTDIRIEPVGDYGIQNHASFRPQVDLHEVKVMGYAKAEDAPALAEKQTIAVSEDTLRQIVVRYIKEKVAAVEWTPKEKAGSYLPGYLYKGVAQGAYATAVSSSYERFLTSIDSDGFATPIAEGYLGMDGAAAFCDIITLVSRSHINGLAQASDTNRLIPLGGLSMQVPGSTTPNWRTGHAGITAEQAYESYALVKPGDVFVSTKGSSQGMLATGETTVVRGSDGKIDPAASTVVVTSTPSSAPWYYYQVDGQQVVSKTAPDAYLSAEPKATYLYGTAWFVDNVVTFEQLWNGVDATDSTPQIRSGHMAYTLYEYTQGAVDQVQVQTDIHFDPFNGRNGVSLGVSSNYRVVSGNAVLTDTDSGKVLFDDTFMFNWSNFSGEYNDANLNAIMENLPVGNYHLKVSVKTGPITDPAVLELPVVSVLDQKFTVIDPQLAIQAERSRVEQGDALNIRLNAAANGIDRIDAAVKYAADLFEFDLAATQEANPGLTFEVSELSQTVSLSGSAKAASGQALATLCFKAIRTAEAPIVGESAPAFTITRSQVGLNGGELTEGGAQGQSTVVEVGYNTAVYEDFLPGWDLLMVNTLDPIIYTYDGKPMYDLTDNGYLVDGKGYACVNAILVSEVNIDKLAEGEQSNPVLKYGFDANLSGWVDMNDVQQVINVLKGTVTPADDMARCIAADVNKDGRVDNDDMLAVWNELR